MLAFAGWKPKSALLAGSVILAVLYTAHYLGHPALPGNNPQFPAGWWGWWDQSNYLKSAAALSKGNLLADQHLYPLGLALLGAAFMRLMPMHPFYFVDLVSLLVTLCAFTSFARRCGIASGWAVAVFVLTAAADPVLLQQWVVPWSTTPLAMVLWLLIATAAAHIDGQRRPASLGLLAVCLPMLRPSDLLLALPPLAACLLVDLRHRRLAWRDALVFALAVLIPAALYLRLHAAIYGLHPSPYMAASKDIGFTLHQFGWKAYVILVDPQAWIGGGEGLLRRCPWMILGAAGLLPAMWRAKTAMLAITLLLHSLVYLAYVDLLPTGFWRYLNVHYWTWAFPGFGLLGLLLLRDLLQPAHRLVAVCGIVLAAILLCIRFDPAPAQPGESIDAVDFAVPGDMPGFTDIYFGQMQLIDAGGTLANVTQVRAIPMEHAVRVLALRRALQAPIRAQGLGLEETAPTLLHASPRFALPFRPWRRPGEAYGPR